MQFKLNRGENGKLFTNGATSSGTKLRLLNSRGNKLYYPYSTGRLTAINHSISY